MTATISSYDRASEALGKLNVDEQLTMLWFVYTKMGDTVTPAAPGAAGSEIAEGLVNQVKALSPQEQIQAQRDIAFKNNTQISREYGSLSPDTKLAFWYFLAVGMANGAIAPLPVGSELSEAGKELLGQLESEDYGKQITFLRGAVLSMGAEAAPGSEI